MTEQLALSLPSALKSIKILFPTIRHGIAIFLDYDGTLTPIVEKPELAILSDSMRKTIGRLVSRFSVTIVSGRDVNVIAKLVAVKGLGYVGSHGLDIVGSPGTGFRKEMALNFLTELDIVESQLRKKIDSIELVRMCATTRIIMPKSRVRLSAGRKDLSNEAQILCFIAGANSIFYGDKLLTTGNNDTTSDVNLLKNVGLPLTQLAK